MEALKCINRICYAHMLLEKLVIGEVVWRNEQTSRGWCPGRLVLRGSIPLASRRGRV